MFYISHMDKIVDSQFLHINTPALAVHYCAFEALN